MRTTPYGPIMVVTEKQKKSKTPLGWCNRERLFVKLVLESEPRILVRLEQTPVISDKPPPLVATPTTIDYSYQLATITDVDCFGILARWADGAAHQFPHSKDAGLGPLPWLKCILCKQAMDGAACVELSHDARRGAYKLDVWDAPVGNPKHWFDESTLCYEREKWMEWTTYNPLQFRCTNQICSRAFRLQMDLCLESHLLFPHLALIPCIPLVIVQLICRYID